jgi:hypothetical protein
MKPIILVMLAVDAGMILACAIAVAFAKSTPQRSRPQWPALIVALAVAGSTSLRIADRHAGQAGADILLSGGSLLFGMALMGAFVAARKRRGVD